jgi:thiol-disulfide isomerase/thioredoxin
MRQLLLAVGLLAVACGVGYTDEDKKETKKDQTYLELRDEFLKKYRAEKDEDAKKGVMKEYGPKFMAMAKQKKKDGFGAAMFAIQIGQISSNNELKDEALGLIKTEYINDPEMAKGGLSTLERVMGKDYKPFLRETMEKSKAIEVRAAACSALIEPLENALAKAEGAEAEKIKKEMGELRKLGVEKFKMRDIFIGGKMDDLKSEDLDGKAVKLSDHKGKVVVLDIWATWCPPCRAMIPHERELVKKLKDKPFVLVSVSFDAEKKTLTDFLEKEKMPWVHWFNGQKGELGEQLNVRFFPTIFVLDAKGVIRFKGVRGEAMDKAVETLLKEMEDEKKSE